MNKYLGWIIVGILLLVSSLFIYLYVEDLKYIKDFKDFESNKTVVCDQYKLPQYNPVSTDIRNDYYLDYQSDIFNYLSTDEYDYFVYKNNDKYIATVSVVSTNVCEELSYDESSPFKYVSGETKCLKLYYTCPCEDKICERMKMLINSVKLIEN